MSTIKKFVAVLLLTLSVAGMLAHRDRAITPGVAVSAAGLAKLDRVLGHASRAGDAAPVGVIVRVRPGTEPRARAALVAVGAVVESELPVVHALTARLSPRQLVAAAADPMVLSMSTDGVVQSAAAVALKPPVFTPATDPNMSLLPNTVPYRTLGVDVSLTGYGVGVAVIDSGIGGALGPRVFKSFNFTTSATKVVSMTAADDFGHGTHVAGLVADAGNQSYGHYGGLSPNVRLISLKVLDKNGAGKTSDVVRAVQFAIQNRATYGIDVINLSLGHPIFESATTDPLVLAVEQAVQAGIVVVVSAGNNGTNQTTGLVGYAGISSPGNAPSAITVGAFEAKNTVTRGDDTVAAFSSRGPSWYDGYSKPDLVAPGRRDIAMTAPEGTLYASVVATSPNKLIQAVSLGGSVSNTRYISLSGTSMAAGMTSGVVARMIEANRKLVSPTATTWAPAALSPNQVKLILEYTAFMMTGYDELTQGAGALNAAGAERVARAADPRIPAGQPWLVSAVAPSTTIGGQSMAWGQRIVWGDRVIWGDSVIVNNDPAFAQRVVWGDRIVWGDRVVWGESTVWTNRVVWGDRIVWGDHTVDLSDATRVVWGDMATLLGLSSAQMAQSTVDFIID